MTALLDLVALLAAITVTVVVGTWVARQIHRDGIGFHSAPRGTEDWSAFGLPSRPYGA